MSSSELSDEDTEGILKKAFDVTLPDDFDPKKAPSTGEEFLQHVIYERKQCKSWTRASLDTSKFNSNQTFSVEQDILPKSTPKAFLPSKEWQQKQEWDFREFRKFVAFAKRDEGTVTISRSEYWKQIVLNEYPTFGMLATFNQASLVILLEIVLQYLDSVEPGYGVQKNICVWLYGVFATLEIPLNPSDYHHIREIGKKCIIIRSRLPEDCNKDVYVPLNLNICIVARIFGQLDLADEV